jgi:hypothetical protein
VVHIIYIVALFPCETSYLLFSRSLKLNGHTIFGFRSLVEILRGGQTLFYKLSIKSKWNVASLALHINIGSGHILVVTRMSDSERSSDLNLLKVYDS